MPKILSERLHYRVSDLILECQAQMYYTHEQMVQLDTKPIKIRGTDTYESIRGTYIHHQIENIIRRNLDLSELELRWTPSQQKKFDFYNNPKNKVVNDLFKKQVGQSMTNFEDWWDFFQPEDCITEQEITFKVPYLSFPVKGTVDFICTIEERKLEYAVTGIMGTSTERKVVVIDWKSGKSGKAMQITAYLYGLKQGDAIWDEHEPFTLKSKLKKDKGKINEYGGMLFLGGNDYDFQMFKYEPHKFLSRCEVYETVSNQPINFATQKFQTSPYVCKYCPFNNQCIILSNELVDISLP